MRWEWTLFWAAVFEYGGELFGGVKFIGAQFGDLDSVRLFEMVDDLRIGLDGYISWSYI